MTKLGIVKNYLKFKLDSLFGVIGSEKSNISYLPNKSGNIGTLCMIGFAEDVIIWNMKTNEIVETIHGSTNDRVTFLTYFHSDVFGMTVSIGYESGYVSVYSLWNMEKLIHLKCHKHPITCITYCKPYGERIICGSKDTSITVIDINDERGFELKGHTSPVTKLHYIHDRDILISTAQDGNIKFWIVEERHCFKTMSNISEAWDFHYCDKQQLLITGSNDALIRLWKLRFTAISDDNANTTIDLTESVADARSNLVEATYLGEIKRSSAKRIVEIKADESGEYLSCNTAEKKIELYKISTEADLKKRLKKKLKKATSSSKCDASAPVICVEDRLKLIRVIEMPARCKSISLLCHLPVATTTASDDGGKQQLEILASMHNNSVAAMYVELPHGKELVVREQITQPGHRTAIIHAQFTSDGMGLFTVSLSEAKLWDKASRKCLFTIGWSKKEQTSSDNRDDFQKLYKDLNLTVGEKLEANCSLLLPGDRHAVIGYKNGVMLVFHLIDGSVMHAVHPHDGAIVSIVPSADGTVIRSASVDKSMRTWRLEYSAKGGRLQLAQEGGNTATGTVFPNGISCLAATPDGQLLAVAFLDNKVRTYLTNDMSRRVLDLHGHTEPVTSVAIRHDSKQLLTGSSDKTVRAWNLPFGDCKIFRGHRDPVTDVRYVPGRRVAFSCDRAGVIIQWDVRTMTEISRLRGHGAAVNCLAIDAVIGDGDNNGGIDEDDENEDAVEEGNAELVSVSSDGSVRLWYESDEILSLEVEAEEEADRQHEKEEMVREEVAIVGAPRATESNILTKKTINTERCADELIEALDAVAIAAVAAADKSATKPAAVDAKMAAMGFTDPQLYLADVLRRVKSGDLELALAQLPLAYATRLMEVTAAMLERNHETLLACRCLIYLSKLHFMHVTATGNPAMAALIDKVARNGPVAVGNYEHLAGFNCEALQYFRTELGPQLQKFTEKRNIAKSKSKKKK